MINNTRTGNDLLNYLIEPIYPVFQTSKLVGLPRWTIKRYLRGYDYEYSAGNSYRKGHQPPVVNPAEENIYASFLDLVDLLYVKEFLKRGFSLIRLRKALKEARELLGTPHFARSVFFTSGNEIVLKLPKKGNLIALMTGGQLTLQEITEQLSVKLDFENITEFGFAQRWYPHGKRGHIVIDPRISFGQPTLIGYGTSTSNIYDLFIGENNNVEPVSKWFNIPTNQITTAVRFEHSLWG